MARSHVMQTPPPGRRTPVPTTRGFSRPRRSRLRRRPWARLAAFVALPTTSLLLASGTGGPGTVARLMSVPGPDEPSSSTSAALSGSLGAAAGPGGGPGAPALNSLGMGGGYAPTIEIASSVLDPQNGAPKFPMSAVLMSAYRAAVAQSPNGCHLTVPLLAAIGQVESGSLVGRTLDSGHRLAEPLYGPVLDGNGFAAIVDTDNGALDG